MKATEQTGLSHEQRQRFDERGLVRLDRAVPPRLAEEMADRLWQGLGRKHGAQRRAPSTWRTERPASFQALQKSGAFKGMASPRVRTMLDDLLGRDAWTAPPHWGQPLVCFPKAHSRWDVPYQSWHLDLPADPTRFSMMVGRLFLILAPLRPQGVGTLVATGSHRIVQRLANRAGDQQSSSAMRKRLQAEHRWFADLMSPDPAGDKSRGRVARFMETATEVSHVPLQVEEMTGEPGDLYLMHPAVLHAAAPNLLDAPRLVLSQFVMPKAWFGSAIYS